MTDIAPHLTPRWDPARRDLPGRAYQDDEIALCSNFETGNGVNFRRLGERHYALDIEPEPGEHRFAGKGVYFCVAALNRTSSPVEVTIEVNSKRVGGEEHTDPDNVPDGSYAGRVKFVVTRRGREWGHLRAPRVGMGRNAAAIAFTAELPPAGASDPVVFFSNHHWYPYTDMAAELQDIAADREGVTLQSIGRSVQGRDILAVEIGPDDPDAPTIVCAATPQPKEMGNHCCRAILEFLLSDAPAAAKIRATHRVCLVPHTNPDGTVLGYFASDAAGKFPYFCGAATAGGKDDAPVEQVALWEYLQDRRPWLFVEWHSNHWANRLGHALLLYERDLLAGDDQRLADVWRCWDDKLFALPDAVEEKGGRTTCSRGYNKSLGLFVATQLGGIPAMLKVHDKFDYGRILDWALAAFLAAVDCYDRHLGDARQS